MLIRICIGFVSLFLTLFAGTAICADDYPSRPIRLVVTFPAGGPVDVVIRLLVPHVSKQLGQSIVVDNRGGAQGVIGVETVARSAPDGYTLVVGIDGPITINPSVYRKLPYDPIRDLVPITQLTSSRLVLLAHPSLPFRTVPDLIRVAASRPGKLTFGSSGIGSAAQMASLLLQREKGISLVHVPYKGGGPALNALLGNEVDILFNSVLGGLPFVRNGRLNALATTGLDRSPVYPDVPTVAESISGFEVTTWYGILGPAGMPQPVIAKLNKAFVEAVQSNEVKDRLESQGLTAIGSSPAVLRALIERETKKWATVVPKVKMELEAN
jgi:tripartite-type tricarboxylate transporter receptor subunit TctC